MTSHPSLVSMLVAAVDSAEAIQRQFDLEHDEALERCARQLAGVLGATGVSPESKVTEGVSESSSWQRVLEPLAPPRQTLETLTIEARFDLAVDHQRAGFLGARPLGVGYGRRFATTTTSSTTFRIEVVASPQRLSAQPASEPRGATPDPPTADP